MCSSSLSPSALVFRHLDVGPVDIVCVFYGSDTVDGGLAVELDALACRAGCLTLLQDAFVRAGVDIAVARLLQCGVPPLVETGVAGSWTGGRGRDRCARHGHGDRGAEREGWPRVGWSGGGD